MLSLPLFIEDLIMNSSDLPGINTWNQWCQLEPAVLQLKSLS